MTERQIGCLIILVSGALTSWAVFVLIELLVDWLAIVA